MARKAEESVRVFPHVDHLWGLVNVVENLKPGEELVDHGEMQQRQGEERERKREKFGIRQSQENISMDSSRVKRIVCTRGAGSHGNAAQARTTSPKKPRRTREQVG